jgi:molecular chaperone GrpE (heat shock protein)
VKTLLRKLMEGEFKVDQRPLPVYLSRDENAQSLKELAAHVLQENDRLQDLNAELQRRGGAGGEAEKLLRNMLPTLDSFDRVLHFARTYPKNDDIDNWLKSVESIYFRLLNLLETYGLFQLRTIGSKVDLNLHEVVEYRPSAEHEHETVISERQKGYIYRGRLLRDAKVVVAFNDRQEITAE